jgi:hypothetical protein
MRRPVETLRFDSGLYAEIHHDPDVEQPFADDEGTRIVVLHRRYHDPSRGACGREPDEVAEWELDHADAWFTIPVFLYDHSGTVYRVGETNPFHCPWDSGRVGIVALERSAWGNGQLTDGELAGHAERVAETYTAWANGECYGYVLHDSDEREIESLWGFIGRDSVTAGATAAACARLSASTPGERTV